MASLLELQAEGIGSLTRVTADLGGSLDKEWRKDLRQAANPIAADAKRRYRGLNNLGKHAARTVRTSVTQKGVLINAGGKPWSLAEEFGVDRSETRRYTWSDLFGKGITWRGNKRIDYRQVLGPWAGNALTVGEDKVAGRAVYPAAAAGRDDAVERLERLRDGFMDRLAKAGN